MTARLTSEVTDHGTIVRAIDSRFGGYYWQAHRDVLGTGETTRTSLIASGTADTRDDAMSAARQVTVDHRPAPATPLVTFSRY